MCIFIIVFPEHTIAQNTDIERFMYRHFSKVLSQMLF